MTGYVTKPTEPSTDVDGEGLGDDPLGADPLLETLYAPTGALPDGGRRAPRKKRAASTSGRSKERKPLPDGQTWRLVTFSFYEEDVARLDALLDEARKRGYRRVSRSQIVRLALRQVDLSKLPDLV
jgi:hypothetical protein